MKAGSVLNEKYWDALTPVHAGSRFYDVEGFLAGRSSLHSIEREALGDVAGKSLLHLQCHFGLDTLSWARLGAEVVGVDFSGASIAQAKALAAELGLEAGARFFQCDVLKLKPGQFGRFDHVVTSYGVITWLSDLDAWARGIATSLKPDGEFFLVDCHPTAYLFESDEQGDLQRCHGYFHRSEPSHFGPEPDYADRDHTTLVSEEWVWSLSDVFAALERAGLVVFEFKEYPKTVYEQFPGMQRDEDGYWELPTSTPSLPLLFSLKARSNHRVHVAPQGRS